MSVAPKPSSRADWKLRLDAELEKDKKAMSLSTLVYSLATVEQVEPPTILGAASASSTGSHSPLTNRTKPRTRSVVHRSFLTLQSSKEATGACILQTTTDVRSAKSAQIHGGSAAEVCWWFPSTQVQFRLQSRAYLLPALSHSWRREFPTDLAGGGEAQDSEGKTQVDWEANRVECFNALSPYLRASFARPAPGSDLVDPESAKGWPNKLPKLGEGTEEEKELVRVAFSNFAVLYLEVEEVDVVDLGVTPNEHCQYTFGGTKWAKRTLVP